MKYIYLVLTLLLLNTISSAQSRLINYHTFTYTNNAYTPLDSVNFSYNFDNKNIGDAQHYQPTHNSKLKYDVCLHRGYEFGKYYESLKEICIYDINDNRTKYTQQKAMLGNGTPLTNHIQVYNTYDNNGNLTMQLLQDWNIQLNMWDSASQENITYDSNNNPIMIAFKNFKTNNPYTKNTTYTYNSNGQLIQILSITWSSNAQTPIYDSNRTTYVYNSTGQLAQTIVVNRQNNTQTPSYDSTNTIYTYDNNGNNDTISKYGYNKNLNIMELKNRDVFNYNNNLLISSTRQFVDYNNILTNLFQYHYNYNTQQLVDTSDKYQWNDKTNNWDGVIRTISTYNTNKYLIEKVTKHWNDTTRKWESRSTSDSTVYRYENVLPTDVYNHNNSTNSVIVFPNPSNGHFINLQITENKNTPYYIAIYTLQGTLITQQYVADGAQQKSIPVSHLANGQYLLSIATKEGKTTQLFTISR